MSKDLYQVILFGTNDSRRNRIEYDRIIVLPLGKEYLVSDPSYNDEAISPIHKIYIDNCDYFGKVAYLHLDNLQTGKKQSICLHALPNGNTQLLPLEDNLSPTQNLVVKANIYYIDRDNMDDIRNCLIQSNINVDEIFSESSKNNDEPNM